MRLDLGRAAAPLALGAVVLAAYGNSLGGSFHYDDFHSIVHNPHIRDLSNLPGFFFDPSLFSVDVEKAMYRPLLLVTYGLNYALGEYDVTGYHVVNLLLHYGCVLLVWQLAKLAGCGGGPALLAGLFFAVHPLGSEPVNYISSRSELLGACLFLAAFRWFLLDSPGSRGVAVLFFAMGLLSKEMVITLPLVLWLFQVWGGGRGGGLPRVRQHLALWLVAATYIVVLIANGSLGKAARVIETNRLSDTSTTTVIRVVGEQLCTQTKAAALYLKLVLFPVGLNVEQQFSLSSSVWQLQVLATGALLLSAAGLGWRRLRRDHLFWLTWPLVTAAPATLVPLNVMANEHRLYVPLAGLTVLAARLLPGGHTRAAPLAALGVTLVVWAGLTVQRNAVWQDELTLWRDSANKSPLMARPHVHLGNALRDQDLSVAAGKEYERALQLEPSHRSARTNLANLYYEQGWRAPDSSLARPFFLKAASEYERVLDLDPDYREALNNLGNAYFMLGRAEAAAGAFQRAVRSHPLFPEAHYNLGHLYVGQGRFSEALDPLRRALELRPDAQTYQDLANAYAGTGRLSEAAEAYRHARSRDAGEPRYARNLGEVLIVLGEQALASGDSAVAYGLWEEARSCYQAVIALGGDRERAAYRLAQLAERLP